MTDKFSWTRIGQLWAFHRTKIYRQWIWITMAMIACYILVQLSMIGVPKEGIYSFATTAMGFIFYYGALLFTGYSDRRFTAQLPASPAEKTFFIMTYCLLVVPAVMIVVWLVCDGFAAMFGYPTNVIEKFRQQSISSLISSGISLNYDMMNIAGYGQLLTVTLFTILAVVYRRRNRILAGVLAAPIGMFFISFVGGIYGAVVALRASVLYESGSFGSLRESMMYLFNVTSPWMVGICCGLVVIFMIVVIVLVRRKLANIQV